MQTISIIVPIYNEAAHIRECLDSILAQADERIALDILVVDGMSNDGTRELVQELAQTHPAIRLIDNPEKTVPYAMNRGINAATGSVIIRIDGHAAMEPDFIKNCLSALDAHPECGCVGGYIENINTTETARIISLAMSSRFGVGSAHFRTGNFEGHVDTLAFGAYRKEVFDKAGMFDEVLTRNQDDEFNFRMIRAGFKIWLSKAIRSRYYVRASFKKLYRQYFQYGYWKVYVNRKHSAVTSVRQLVPFLFVGFLFGGFALSWLHPLLCWAYSAGLAVYALADLASAFSQSKNPATALQVAWACFTMHFSYGLGYWQGILHFMLLRKQPGARQQSVMR